VAPAVITTSGVAPSTSTLGWVAVRAVESFCRSSSSVEAAVNTAGQRARMASRSSSVRFRRLAYLRQLCCPKPTGHLVTSKTLAPSWERSWVTFSRNPSTSPIIAITVATPMTMPSRVSRERNG